MAIAAAANLGLVLFDLTYVPWRNFWLQGNIPIPLTHQVIAIPIPQISCQDSSAKPPRQTQESFVTCLYDPVKGIEYHPDTQSYLNAVERLRQQVNQKGLEAGLQSAEVQATLADLRKLSAELITSNPFESVGKSGTLEKIKNRMRDRVSDGRRSDVSSADAFTLFWNTPHLSPQTWQQEITWFDQSIAPLIATNYYRTISENGEFTNNFWALDAPFILLFALEFLARTFYISRRFTSLNWLDAMIWRWYDMPLFTPFSLFFPPLALLRTIPTAIQLHQANIIDLHQINAQVRQGFVSAIAEEITEVVVVQVVNQVQHSIRQGELTGFLQRTSSRRYVDINNVNEIEAIAKHLTQLLVYQVFPKIQPDLETLLRHSIHSVLNQSPAYRGLQVLPGIGSLPSQITERLVSDITQTSYNSLKAALEDPKTIELAIRLIQNLSSTLASEAQRQNNLDEVQILLSDLLEEIKINYIQRLSEEDVTLLLDQTRQLQQIARKS